MKAFDFYNEFGETEYVDDCKIIWDYLSDKGSINFSKRQLSEYYHQFSDECYCAVWLILNDDILEEFAEWLSHQEV